MVVTNDARGSPICCGQCAPMDGSAICMRPRRSRAGYPHIDPRFLFLTTGFNVRPTEINAAIGLEQLKNCRPSTRVGARLPAVSTRVSRPWSKPASSRLIRHDPRVTPAPFGYTVLCRSRDVRDGLRRHLEAAGVETRPVICGNLARQPALAHHAYRISGELSGADHVMDCGLYWGTHPFMTEDEVRYIIATVRQYFPETDLAMPLRQRG